MGIFEKFYQAKRREQIDEGVKKVGEHVNGNKKATVHKDSDVGEYKVKFHTDGKHHSDADYHTDDKEDAHGTAKHWISAKPTNEEVISMDESAVLIEYIQDLEEKLKAYVAGADGYKSRAPDEHKNEPAASAERKQAADKIRAARKSTGLHGSKIDRGDIAVTGATKSPSNTKKH